MEQQPSKISYRREEPELISLKEWDFNAQISRENTMSRRFLASHITSFREDTRSFRSNITISSTVSSPGWLINEEIDPSTYSFTTALKALQARAGYNIWECSSPDGIRFALNSKWYEAEKYICNPLSGEVPMECLSSKTLSGRSFRHLTSRITMSAPLLYSNPIRRHVYAKPCVVVTREDDYAKFPIKEDKMKTKDVGTQSTPVHDLRSSSTPSPTISTPSIVERSLKRSEAEDGDSSNDNTKLRDEIKVKIKEKETSRQKEDEEREKDCHKEERSKKDNEQKWKRCSTSSGRKQGSHGCLFWMRKRQRENHMPRKKISFLLSLESCQNES